MRNPILCLLAVVSFSFMGRADSGLKRYLYLSTPDAAQEGGAGKGILVFDIDHGHRFVRRIDIEIGTRSGIESSVQTSIDIEAGNVIAVGAINHGEMTGDKDLAVRLQSERPELVVSALSRIESSVQTSVGVEPRNVASCTPFNCIERPSNDELGVGLEHDGVNAPVEPGAGIKREIRIARRGGRMKDKDRRVQQQSRNEGG